MRGRPPPPGRSQVGCSNGKAYSVDALEALEEAGEQGPAVAAQGAVDGQLRG